MADSARALLKAKRLERGTVTKQRIIPTRREDAQSARPKRKLESSPHTAASEPSPIISSPEGPGGKRRRVDEQEQERGSPSNGFPADFFSDAARTIPNAIDADEDDETPQLSGSSGSFVSPNQPTTSASASASLPLPSTSIDEEYEAFQRAIQKAAQAKPPDLSAFARATVVADPELVTELPAGFPSSIVDREDGGPSTSAAAAAETEEDETEIDKFKRKEQEDRELVIDRLLDEERAQEDADAKVNALKARLEAIKQKRAARKAAG